MACMQTLLLVVTWQLAWLANLRWWVSQLILALPGADGLLGTLALFSRIVFILLLWFCFSDSCHLGSVAGSVIHANGRMTFEDDLMSGGLLYFTTKWTSIRTELTDSRVTLGETRGGEVSRDCIFACRIHPAAQSAIGKQEWVTGFHCVCAYQLDILSLSCSQYSWRGWDDNAGLGNLKGIGCKRPTVHCAWVHSSTSWWRRVLHVTAPAPS